MFIIVVILIGLIAVSFWFFIRAISDGNTSRVIGSLTLMGIVGGLGMVIDYIDNQKSLTDKGQYYLSECQLIETNIDNGLFQSNTNKLKCGDAIENVSVDEYQEAIKAYKESQREK
ncbi:TPA: hypothetical protein ACNUX9_003863 [Providencia rettgeri]